MQLFYVKPENPQALLEDEADHCVRVLRHRVGDVIFCIDGNGRFYQSRITQIERFKVRLSILGQEVDWGEHNLQIRLFFTPLKSRDRLEWMIEKAVELGVTHLHPILTARSEKTTLSLARLERIMIAAIKQAKRSRLPICAPLVLLKEFSNFPPLDIGLIAHCNATVPISQSLGALASAGGNSFGVAIGPEGDFLEEEIHRFEKFGFYSVSLGANRLRSETAAIFVLSVIKNMQGY